MKLFYPLVFLIALFPGNTKANELALNDDVTCFAVSLYFESRGEILAASVAVAEVILTRIKSRYYSNDACGVIKSQAISPRTGELVCAFEWYCNLESLYIDLSDPIENKAWLQAKHLANAYLSSSPPIFTTVQNASLFHDNSVTPNWALSPDVVLVAIIGNLKFYEEFRSGILISKNEPHIINGNS